MACAVCGKRGTKQCSRCRHVRYCSWECQKRDWSEEGHKHDCATWVAIDRVIAKDVAARPKAPSDVHCFLCLEGGNDLVHCGCCCRGRVVPVTRGMTLLLRSAGYAHVECFSKMLAARDDDGRNDMQKLQRMYKLCPTCGGQFSGEMRSRTDLAWWRRSREFSSSAWHRCQAAMDLADTLATYDTEADIVLGIFQRLLDDATREFGPKHVMSLRVMANLGTHLLRYSDARGSFDLLSRAISELRRNFPPTETLAHALVSRAFARARLAKIDDAIAEAREAWQVAIEACGADSERAFSVFTNFVGLNIISDHADRSTLAQVEALAAEAYARCSRIYGPDHVRTLALLTRINEIREKLATDERR